MKARAKTDGGITLYLTKREAETVTAVFSMTVENIEKLPFDTQTNPLRLRLTDMLATIRHAERKVYA